MRSAVGRPQRSGIDADHPLGVNPNTRCQHDFFQLKKIHRIDDSRRVAASAQIRCIRGNCRMSYRKLIEQLRAENASALRFLTADDLHSLVCVNADRTLEDDAAITLLYCGEAGVVRLDRLRCAIAIAPGSQGNTWKGIASRTRLAHWCSSWMARRAKMA